MKYGSCRSTHPNVTLFKKIKKELAPDTPGFQVLCPIRWTVRANSLQSVIDNWLPLLELRPIHTAALTSVVNFNLTICVTF